MFGAKIVSNVIWHYVLFCLSIVCGWALLMKTQCGEEECVCACVCVSALFLNGLLDRLHEVCWVISSLSPVLSFPSKTGRTTHLYRGL